jgi:hypothetical protein
MFVKASKYPHTRYTINLISKIEYYYLGQIVYLQFYGHKFIKKIANIISLDIIKKNKLLTHTID